MCAFAQSTGPGGVTKQVFGAAPSGQQIYLYTLRNSKGLEAAITNYGGRLVSLKTPDRQGKFDDIVLGFDSAQEYLQNNPFFGAIAGRYANRIANGEFKLDGVTYKLARNNGPNTLHGGLKGFDKKVWSAHEARSKEGPEVVLQYLSKDGEEGFPGDLEVTVTYTLTENNELKIDYDATTDKDTVLNLTNHSYFNLSGQGTGSILNDVVTINADKFLPADENLIPTGEIRSVAGTPFDFRKPTAIGAHIDDKDPQLKFAKGYDQTFVLNRTGAGPSLAARVTDPHSGRVLEVLTTQPGVQFYTANHMQGPVRGKGGAAYGFRSAFCLETQHFPDSPNKPNFPSTELKPGERFHSVTVFKFSVE